MFGNKEYIGLALEEDYIKFAHVEVDGDKLRLLRVDRITLSEKVDTESKSESESAEEEIDMDDSEAVFGLEEEEEVEEEELEDDLMAETEDEDLMDMAVEEGSEEVSNGVLLGNLFHELDDNRVDIGVNIPAGQTIIQVLRDTDYEEVKNKDLRDIVEEKLESIYGTPKSEEFYAYEIRDDGALVLASVEEYSPLLQIVDESIDFYGGKTFVHDVIPDETALVGLVRANYEFDETEISAIIQFESEHCRIVFMKGDQVWQVSPTINEGTYSNRLLNTIFSKLLYQLDTGEIPSLDRILLANNTIGQQAVDFFKDNFPDLEVSNLRFDPAKFDLGEYDESVVNGYTTAIGMAWIVSGFDQDSFPTLTFLPSYVSDRQKVFKLQWHGILLLLLIGLSPIILNYWYQTNVREINRLESQIQTTEQRINEVQETVDAVNQLNADLSQIQTKLTLVDTLVQNSRKWTTTLNMVNQRAQSVNSLWITSLNTVGEGLRIEGRSLFRNRITQFAGIFHKALVDQVNLTTVREEEEVYEFTITVLSIVEDEGRFAPEQNRRMKQLISTR